MFLAILEVFFAIFTIWFVVSQIIIPLVSGTKIVPMFRSGKQEAINDLILDEKDKIEQEELLKRLRELRQKGKKNG